MRKLTDASPGSLIFLGILLGVPLGLSGFAMLQHSLAKQAVADELFESIGFWGSIAGLACVVVTILLVTVPNGNIARWQSLYGSILGAGLAGAVSLIVAVPVLQQTNELRKQTAAASVAALIELAKSIDDGDRILDDIRKTINLAHMNLVNFDYKNKPTDQVARIGRLQIDLNDKIENATFTLIKYNEIIEDYNYTDKLDLRTLKISGMLNKFMISIIQKSDDATIREISDASIKLIIDWNEMYRTVKSRIGVSRMRVWKQIDAQQRTLSK